jgi:hypothetical protein
MRNIDDAHDAEDQGKPGGDEEQAGRRSETIERLKGNAFQIHPRPPLQPRPRVTAAASRA